KLMTSTPSRRSLRARSSMPIVIDGVIARRLDERCIEPPPVCPAPPPGGRATIAGIGLRSAFPIRRRRDSLLHRHQKRRRPPTIFDGRRLGRLRPVFQACTAGGELFSMSISADGFGGSSRPASARQIRWSPR